MTIDLTKPLALLFALSLAGLTACAGEEPPAASAESEATYGEEEPAAEEGAAEEPAAEEGAAEEPAAEEPAAEGEAGLE